MIITETQVVNNTSFNHLYSDQGYYLRRDDDKLFVDVLEETTSKHTYTETNIIAPHSLLSRVATLESKHNTLESKHNTLESKPHIIETYVNGTSWYRLYSDGWCVQFGRISSMTQNGNIKINLVKEYKDISYFVFTQQNRTANYNSQYNNSIQIDMYSNTKTTNSFVAYDFNYGLGFDWITLGYAQ